MEQDFSDEGIVKHITYRRLRDSHLGKSQKNVLGKGVTNMKVLRKSCACSFYG